MDETFKMYVDNEFTEFPEGAIQILNEYGFIFERPYFFVPYDRFFEFSEALKDLAWGWKILLYGKSASIIYI